MEPKKVLSVRRFKAGYEVRTELHGGNGTEWGGNEFEMKVAYTPEGYYIGDARWAYRCCVKRGIKPELIRPDANVCSIGYSAKLRKWFGWSHRAIFGFRTGSRVKLGDCGYQPSIKREFLQDLKAWYCEDDMYHDLKLTPTKTGIQVEYTFGTPAAGGKHKSLEKYPKKWGRGEWTAKNMADAKQMAIDFANGVS